MNTIKLYSAIAVCSLIAMSCSNDGTPRSNNNEIDNPNGFDMIEIPTVSEISLSDSEMELTNHVNKFGVDLFNGVFSRNDLSRQPNVSVSPLSMAACLGLAANAHDDYFKNAVLNTMGCKDIPELNIYFNKVLRYLPDPVNGCELSFANSIWHISLASPTPAFAEISRNLYYAPINKYDEDERMKLADRVNHWCDMATKGMISKFLDQQEAIFIDLITLNAMYFAGEWETSFDRSLTSKELFHGVEGDIAVDMMCRDFSDRIYRKSDKGIAIYLPYNGDFYMALVLPEEGVAADEVVGVLRHGLPELPENADGWTSEKTAANSSLRLPKFKVSFDDLTGIFNKVMEDMGYPTHGYVPEFNLDAPRISYRQKTAVEVDENGAKAAAVSGIIVDRPSIDLVFDRPFLYSIVNSKTGLTLMTGYIGDPTQE